MATENMTKEQREEYWQKIRLRWQELCYNPLMENKTYTKEELDKMSKEQVKALYYELRSKYLAELKKYEKNKKKLDDLKALRL